MEIFRISTVGGPAEEDREREKIERRLLDVLEGELSVEALLAARRSSLPRPARIQHPSVRISNDDSDLYSIVDVVAQDRPGLLYDITRTLADLGLNVAMSRVSTQASRISDAFYVTDQGLKILDPERREEIRGALLAAVETTPS
jgi:[protein-PII] uridylyltransferase